MTSYYYSYIFNQANGWFIGVLYEVPPTFILKMKLTDVTPDLHTLFTLSETNEITPIRTHRSRNKDHIMHDLYLSFSMSLKAKYTRDFKVYGNVWFKDRIPATQG